MTNERIRTLLQKGKYQELNTLLESYQKAFEQDVKNEDDVYNAFAAFEVAPPTLENPLHNWIKAFPNSSSAYLARAVYYSKLGWESRGYKWAKETNPAQFAHAHEKFDLATQFDSSHAETYYWKGQSYIRQDQPAEALLAFKKSIELNPRHFDSYRSLDWVLAKRGEWDAIIAYWNQFLELEPNHAKAYLERGGSYYHKGDLKSALLDARKACDLGEQEACEKYHSLKARIQTN